MTLQQKQLNSKFSINVTKIDYYFSPRHMQVKKFIYQFFFKEDIKLMTNMTKNV